MDQRALAASRFHSGTRPEPPRSGDPSRARSRHPIVAHRVRVAAVPGFSFALTGRGPNARSTSVPSGGIFSVFVENTRSASFAELSIGRSRMALPKLATVIKSPSSAAYRCVLVAGSS